MSLRVRAAGHRARWLAAAAVLVAAVATFAVVRSLSDAPLPHHAATFDYRPGLRADLYLPKPKPAAAPLIVLVPGGGWTHANAAGLAPLADRLAASGFVAVTATYRVGTSASRFPVPVGDVICAVDGAAARSRAAGVPPTRVVLLGHSAGAQLAALAALTGDRFRGACRWPATRIDGLVGLAGPYDIASFSTIAAPLLGTTPVDDPARWREANPLTWASQRPQLPVLLATGTADDLVSPWFANTFADALRSTGHRVRLLLVDGATHASIYRTNVIAGPIIGWMRGLR